ncbi:MAG: L,D-transpeptidase, partial [Paludibacteraceae bacterium]|nr:L,D-transpeptidase [Paludibacteraceae bacterium]
PHRGIGIHGSTNNEGSVPGRASEGCIRLLDKDIIDLRKNYAFVGMKVIIKSEETDDLPFEIRAFRNQHIQRKRHLNPNVTLSNEQVENAIVEQVIGPAPQ